MTITTTQLYALRSIKGVGNKSVEAIINDGYSIENLRNLEIQELKTYIRGSAPIEELKNNFEEYYQAAESELNNFKDKEISVIARTDNNYPKLYKNLKNLPTFIYCKGNIDLLNHKKSIAVIGTRDATQIGYSIGYKTAQYFALEGYNIISGLAAGIDTAGHKGALDAGGYTTAILVDLVNIYPKENKELAEIILENNGLLVSENKPGGFITKGMFVARDRLQSGLSLAVFPIETNIKGGTMHTVNFAKEQNRLIFCPDLMSLKQYDLEKEQSKGVVKLIDEGIAIPYTGSTYKTIVQTLEKHRIS